MHDYIGNITKTHLCPSFCLPPSACLHIQQLVLTLLPIRQVLLQTQRLTGDSLSPASESQMPASLALSSA